MQVPEDKPKNQLKSAVRHHWAVADDLSKTAEEFKIRVPEPVTEVCAHYRCKISCVLCMHA